MSSAQREKISICIPTRNRPEHLIEAVESCFAQDYRPLEILVGDDSDDGDSQARLDALSIPEQVDLRYWRHPKAKGQAGNINALLSEAGGDRIVVLHDDDTLLPGALTEFDQCWRTQEGVVAVYGRQQVVADDGVVLPQDTEQLNSFYWRTKERAGIQASSFDCAIAQQFPNDGYMVDRRAAHEVGFRGVESVGKYTDFDFGIRYAQATSPGLFHFTSRFTSTYRLSAVSVSRNEAANRHNLYEAMLEIEPPAASRSLFDQVMRSIRYNAVEGYASNGQRAKALRLVFSDLGLSPVSPRRAFLAAGALFPGLLRWRNRTR